MMNDAIEVNFDGLPGPTYSYAGLAYGNIASKASRGRCGNPREAALQSLGKMKLLSDLGLKQAVIPPQLRPRLDLLRRLGYRGTDSEILDRSFTDDPDLLAAVYSSSFMWAANAATISPSTDTADGRVHITPANFSGEFHRSLESQDTFHDFKAIFSDERHFIVHEPLPYHLADEGAANHMRLAPEHGRPGVEIFIYGRSVRDASDASRPLRYPARQTREAQEAIARLHQLSPHRVVFLRQNPAAIDAGVFHNDVISLTHENLIFTHEEAFDGGEANLKKIRSIYATSDLNIVSVPEERISISTAVATYLFNSQTLNVDSTHRLFLAPIECKENESVHAYLEELVQRGLFHEIRYVDLRHSMRNGGGPACLRLRVVLTPEQMDALPVSVFFCEELHSKLEKYICLRYRDRLSPDDFRDPEFMRESIEIYCGMRKILDIESIVTTEGKRS